MSLYYCQIEADDQNKQTNKQLFFLFLVLFPVCYKYSTSTYK